MKRAKTIFAEPSLSWRMEQNSITNRQSLPHPDPKNRGAISITRYDMPTLLTKATAKNIGGNLNNESNKSIQNNLK